MTCDVFIVPIDLIGIQYLMRETICFHSVSCAVQLLFYLHIHCVDRFLECMWCLGHVQSKYIPPEIMQLNL